MGWNSWDCFGTTVTEAEVLANAEFTAEHLLPYGWDTIVDVDRSDPAARSAGYNADAPQQPQPTSPPLQHVQTIRRLQALNHVAWISHMQGTDWSDHRRE
jgi:hypothetical protein